MDLRSELYKSIVLAGGSTKFPGLCGICEHRLCSSKHDIHRAGFGERLLNEVRKLGPRGRKIRIHAPPDRQFTTWAGGCVGRQIHAIDNSILQNPLLHHHDRSILANLFSFKTMWLTRRNYQDHGSSLVYREDFS